MSRYCCYLSVVVFATLVCPSGYAQSSDPPQPERTKQALLRGRTAEYLLAVARADQALRLGQLARAEQLLHECPQDLRAWEWHYLLRLIRTGRSPWPSTGRITTVEVLTAVGRAILVRTIADNPYVTNRFRTLPRPAGTVFGLAISPDGRRIYAAVGPDHPDGAGSVASWDASTGRSHTLVPCAACEGQWIDYAPDGKRFATIGRDETVRVYDPAGKELHALAGLHSVSRVYLHPDGQRLLTCSDSDASAILWELKSGKKLFTVSGVRVCSGFDKAGKLVPGSRLGEITLFDAATGKLVRTMEASDVCSVAWSPDGARLASSDSAGNVTLWSASDGKKLLRIELKSALPRETGQYRGIQPQRPIAFSTDGSRLATFAGERRAGPSAIYDVVVWDLKSGKAAAVLSLKFFGSFGRLPTSLAFSADGKQLAVGGDDVLSSLFGTDRELYGIHLWDIETKKERWSRSINGKPERIVLAPDGTLAVASACRAAVNGLQHFDIQTGKEMRLRPECHTMAVTGVTVSRDGKHLASSGADGLILLWRAADGALIRKLDYFDESLGEVSFSPDGSKLAAADVEQNVRVCDVASGAELYRRPGRRNGTVGLTWTPDGRFLLLANSADAIPILEAATGKQAGIVKAQAVRVVCSPDGKLLLTRTDDSDTVRAWDWQKAIAGGDSVLLWELKTGPSVLSSMALTPDGRRLITGHGDGSVRLWDVATGLEAFALDGGGRREVVPYIAVSADGSQIVTGGWHSPLRVWSAR